MVKHRCVKRSNGTAMSSNGTVKIVKLSDVVVLFYKVIVLSRKLK